MSHISSLTLWSSIKVPRALSVSLQQKRSIPLVEFEEKVEANSSFNNLNWKRDLLNLPRINKSSATTLRSFECIEPYSRVVDSYSPLQYLNSSLISPSTSEKSPKRRKKKISFVTIPEIYVIDDNCEDDWKDKNFITSDPYGVGNEVPYFLKDFGGHRGGPGSIPNEADRCSPFLGSESGPEEYLPHNRKTYLPIEDVVKDGKEKNSFGSFHDRFNYTRRLTDRLKDSSPQTKPWKMDELEEINGRYKRLESRVKKNSPKKMRKNKFKVSKPLRKGSPTTKNKFNSTVYEKKTINESESDAEGNEIFYDCEMVNSLSNLSIESSQEKPPPRKKIAPADENYYESKLAQLYKIKLGLKT